MQALSVVSARGPEIVLVRHGETEWTLTGQHTGTSDLPLTEHGKAQGELLRTWLAGRTFAHALTSPLERAADTCRLAGFGRQADRRSELVEWNYGEYEGLTTPQIRERNPDWSLWRDGCPGGETANEIAARVDPVVAQLRDLGGDAVVFAHGHLLRVLTARWVHLGPEAGALLALSPATLSALGWERETAVIRVWNARGPLEDLA
jgi:broad specificity phosphatase PhoE